MRKLINFLTLIILCFFVLSFSFKKSFTEKTIDIFSLKNTNNKIISLTDYKKAKGFIIVFTCNKCPMAKLYTERLNNLYAKFINKEIYLLAINSMDTLAYKEESFLLMQKKVKKEKLNFPYLQDNLQIVGKQFGATHTPQAYVIWKNYLGKWVVKYEGSIDNNALEPKIADCYIEKAIGELLNNKPVSNQHTQSVGCRIFYRGETTKMN